MSASIKWSKIDFVDIIKKIEVVGNKILCGIDLKNHSFDEN